jgi:hypothetical protein
LLHTRRSRLSRHARSKHQYDLSFLVNLPSTPSLRARNLSPRCVLWLLDRDLHVLNITWYTVLQCGSEVNCICFVFYLVYPLFITIFLVVFVSIWIYDEPLLYDAKKITVFFHSEKYSIQIQYERVNIVMASSRRLALHGFFHQPSDPCFKLFLMHRSSVVKECVVLAFICRPPTCQQGLSCVR